jgi:hypothetical protein
MDRTAQASNPQRVEARTVAPQEHSTLTMATEFESALAKIERAKTHARSLQDEIRVFFDARPYRFDIKVDPETRRTIYYLDDVAPVPRAVSMLFGDAMHNARSALDHAAYQLWRNASPNGGGGKGALHLSP